MIVDLPSHTEQAIIAKAKQQGVSVAEWLSQLVESDPFEFLEVDGIYSTNQNEPLTAEQFQAVWDSLDESPNPTPAMRALMATYGNINRRG